MSELADEEKNHNSSQKQSPMSKMLGFVGFGAGVVVMIAFIPHSDSQVINFVVAALAGGIGFGLGSWIGSLMDKR